MKRLFILLGVMGAAVLYMLSETDKKEMHEEGVKIKKKHKKSHFHKKQLAAG